MAKKGSMQGIPLEETEQTAFATWMTNRGIKFFAIPNGGYRKPLEAMRLKLMGVQSGVPDLFIPIPSGGYNGCFIEMKRIKGGTLSENQKYWMDFLRSKGYHCAVAAGCGEAKEIIEHYLSLTPKAS